MAHVIATYAGRKQAERDRDEGIDLIEVPRPGRPEDVTCRVSSDQSLLENGFQFGEGLFGRIEVGTVRRQKPELCADAFDRGADVGLLVDGEVVEDHDVAGLQRDEDADR